MKNNVLQIARRTGLALVIVGISAGFVWGQIERDAEVVASGGGTSSNNSLTLYSVVGQAGGTSATSSSMQIDSGFLPAVFLSAQTVTDRRETSSDELPEEFELKAAYPNPFNPTTRIGYTLPERSDVRLTVYNALGRRIETLVDEHQAAGRHEITFRAGGLPTGIYYYRLQAGSFQKVRAVSLVK